MGLLLAFSIDSAMMRMLSILTIILTFISNSIAATVLKVLTKTHGACRSFLSLQTGGVVHIRTVFHVHLIYHLLALWYLSKCGFPCVRAGQICLEPSDFLGDQK